MLGFVAGRLMALDIEAMCNAEPHERTGERTNHRNGYRRPNLADARRHGGAPAPEAWQGLVFPAVLEPRRAAEKAMTAALQQAYVHGLSTRSVDDLVKVMGMAGFSKSQVSGLCAEIDQRVNAFLIRPIGRRMACLSINPFPARTGCRSTPPIRCNV